MNPHGRLNRLSFGQRKKALIAFALSLNAEVLLLDEPGNGLDIPSKLCLRRLLSQYAHPERTVILSTHQVRDIEDIVDHITVIDNGRLMLNTSVSELESTVAFVHSDRIMADTLFSEKVTGGYINILKCEDTPGYNTGNLDMEVLFDACTIGGRSFIQYLTAASGGDRKEVDYVL